MCDVSGGITMSNAWPVDEVLGVGKFGVVRKKRQGPDFEVFCMPSLNGALAIGSQPRVLRRKAMRSDLHVRKKKSLWQVCE